MINIEGVEIRWTGHDGFRLNSKDKSVYVDPYKLGETYNQKNDADILLISHNHFDHLSIEDINKIINKSTRIVCANECVDVIKKEYSDNEVISLKPGQTKTVDSLVITGIAAYNTNKDFHPKKDEKVGFLIKVDGLTIYHTGDSDIIPEMEGVNPDILLVPVSGTYVMTAKEAIKATNEIIKPKKLAIPMHYNSIVGTIQDAEEFFREVDVCKAVVMDIE